MNLRTGALFALSLLLFPAVSRATEITADTTWAGVVTVREDTRVARGATLTILPGTKVFFQPAESTKTEPHFWSPDTELAVEGRLLVKGTTEKPVALAPETGLWGGVIIAPGGEAEIQSATVSGADEAVLVRGGKLTASDLVIQSSSTGLVIGPGATLSAERVRVSGCGRGVVDLTGEGARPPEGITVTASTDADYLSQRWFPPKGSAPPKPASDAERREFVGEYTVYGEETWKGTVILNGRVTVPPGSTLKIAPGAKVLFRKRDTNGDGLGEGELLVLGSVRCAGTKENPVLFDSAEENPAPGDWDKVSIISSEDEGNRFEFAVFRHGTMALHAHFSSFAVYDSLFEANLRGLQFQESANAVVSRSSFRQNKQAMRFRDSKVAVSDCELAGNDYAFHIFRSDVVLNSTKVYDTVLGGLLAKESKLTMRDNLFLRSRAAMKLKGEGSELAVTGGELAENVENALSLNDVKARVDGVKFSGAGLDLVGIDGGEAVFRGSGFGKSGRDAIHLNSKSNVDASCNDWSGTEPSKRIYDYDDDRTLGIVLLNSKCN